MLRDLQIVASTALVAVVWLSTPSDGLSPRAAANLRGGEPCTQHVEDVMDPSCFRCFTMWTGVNYRPQKCDSSGTNWQCDNFTGPFCQECFLGPQSPCGGNLYRYEEFSNCEGVGTLMGSCNRTQNAQAYSQFCVQNCDIVP